MVNWNHSIETKPQKWCILQNKSLNLVDILKYKTRVSHRIESVATRIEPTQLESVTGWNQQQDGINRYHIETSPLVCSAHQLTGFYMITASVMKGLSRIQPPELKSAATRIQRLELESAVGRRKPQFVSSRRNSSQPWDGVSRNSYPAAETRVSRGTESAATRIQQPELESAVGWSQKQLLSSRQNLSRP